MQVSEVTRMPDGRVVNKVLEHPQSTLKTFALEPEDVKSFERIPQFPINSSQLAKYDLKYIGTEKVDEIDTYIFKVTPKTVDRAHSYLDGIIWVDTQVSGSCEDVWEMGERAGRCEVCADAVHYV